jgi:hypothetical protein
LSYSSLLALMFASLMFWAMGCAKPSVSERAADAPAEWSDVASREPYSGLEAPVQPKPPSESAAADDTKTADAETENVPRGSIVVRFDPTVLKNREHRSAAESAEKKAEARQEIAETKEPTAKTPEAPKVWKPACETCLGARVVPHASRKRIVHVAADPEPKIEDVLPWQPCPACARSADAKDLVEEETKRRKASVEKHAEWEKRVYATLLAVQTPHVTIHAQMPKQETIELANTVEDLVIHLQEKTRSCVLTPTRLDQFGILALTGKDKYSQVLDSAKGWKEFSYIKDWNFHRKVGGIWARDLTGGSTVLVDFSKSSTYQRDRCLAYFDAGILSQAERGCPDRDKGWLSAGFSYYCQQAVLNRVRVGTVEYLVTETPNENDWNSAARRAMEKGDFRPWSELLAFRLEALSPADHLESFSVVSYLMGLDGPKFARFIVASREGMKRGEALQTAYGKTLAELEADWKEWVNNGIDLGPERPAKKPGTAKAKPPADSKPLSDEQRAATKLRLAKQLIETNRTAAKQRLQEIVRQHAGTEAAKEAAEILRGMEKSGPVTP